MKKWILLILHLLIIPIIGFGQLNYSSHSFTKEVYTLSDEKTKLPMDRLMFVVNNYKFAGVSNDLDDLKRYSFLLVEGKAEQELNWCYEILFSTSSMKQSIMDMSIQYKDYFLTFGIGGIIGTGGEDLNLYIRGVVGPVYYWGEFTTTNPNTKNEFGDWDFYYNAALGIDLFSFLSCEVGISKIPFVSVGICF